jgi:hypothetical protein
MLGLPAQEMEAIQSSPELMAKLIAVYGGF